MEKVASFNYVGSEISRAVDFDVKNKLNKFTLICPTIHRLLKYKTRKETKLTSYKTMAVPVPLYGSETGVGFFHRERQRKDYISGNEISQVGQRVHVTRQNK